MAKKKTTKSLTELKSWLEGLVEFQDAGWTPDAKQWGVIMKAIKSAENDPLSNDDIIKIVEDYKKKNGEVFNYAKNEKAPNQQHVVGSVDSTLPPPPSTQDSLLQGGEIPPVLNDPYEPTPEEMQKMLENAQRANEGTELKGSALKTHKSDEFV